MDSLERELKRGTLELILLKILEMEDMYGYQIVATLETMGGKLLMVKEGTLYPVLYRLEDQKLIESYRDIPERGVPRKYYRITEKGRGRLVEMLEIWRSFAKVMESVISREEQGEEGK